MRSDMAKVVTERPRRGHGNPSKKWGRRLRKNEYDAEDHGPKRAPIARRHQYGWNAKEFSDLLGPLRRYLRKQVGRPWDKVCRYPLPENAGFTPQELARGFTSLARGSHVDVAHGDFGTGMDSWQVPDELNIASESAGGRATLAPDAPASPHHLTNPAGRFVVLPASFGWNPLVGSGVLGSILCVCPSRASWCFCC